MNDYESQIIALTESTDRLTRSAKECTFNGEGWAPAITIGHISDVDTEVWMARFELMVNAQLTGQTPPALAWWEPDGEKTAATYADFTLDESLALLHKSRTSMVVFLKSLTEAERNAPAIHKTFGTITIESMLQIILNHDEEHRATFN
ncbi:MAG: DinB family protein [Candidatus Planktophila sp.]|nr:DinB family protein [Candidatus Planktophila sp.]